MNVFGVTMYGEKLKDGRMQVRIDLEGDGQYVGTGTSYSTTDAITAASLKAQYARRQARRKS